jgi:hypothetical protein
MGSGGDDQSAEVQDRRYPHKAEWSIVLLVESMALNSLVSEGKDEIDYLGSWQAGKQRIENACYSA